MLLNNLFLFCLSASFSIANSSSSQKSLDIEDYDPKDVIYRDVAIVGGGAAGTYTAVHLKDHGKTVILIEKKDKLGGHAETYIAPNGYAITYGVIVWGNTTIVRDYFGRFNIPLKLLQNSHLGGGDGDYADFRTGKRVNYTVASDEDQTAAFNTYRKLLAMYPGLQEGFKMTYPVAEELLLPFGDFVRKYKLEAFLSTVFILNQGYAPLLEIPTLYMLKYLNENQLDSTFNGNLITEAHDTYLLYEAAGRYLGASNVLTNSVPVAMDRSCSPVKIVVETPDGCKLVVAKKIVSAIPPTLDNLHGYDLSRSERRLFSKWKVNGYYTGIMNNTGIPDGLALRAIQLDQPYALPKLPGIYTLGRTTPTELTSVDYGAPTALLAEEVKADIEKALRRLQKEQGFPQTKPDWVRFASHAPFNLEVDVEDIKDGFYEELWGLNGERNTFYNGAAFMTQASTALWQYTKQFILPMVLDSLEE